MPRIRTLKPDACTSKSLAKCSRDARLFFMLLWTHLDDRGRIECLYKKLAGNVFPMDEDVTAADVRRWIEELEAADFCLRRYEIGGTEYLCAPKFNQHQVINKPTPSRLPSPPWEEPELPTEDPIVVTPTQSPVVTPGASTETPDGDPTESEGTGKWKVESGSRDSEPNGSGDADAPPGGPVPVDEWAGIPESERPQWARSNPNHGWLMAERVLWQVHQRLLAEGIPWDEPTSKDIQRDLKSDGPLWMLVDAYGEDEALEMFVWAALNWNSLPSGWPQIEGQRRQIRDGMAKSATVRRGGTQSEARPRSQGGGASVDRYLSGRVTANGRA